MEKTNFENLLHLKKVQQAVKEELGAAYDPKVKIFVDLITKVMQSNNINEFEAMKLIKETLSIYKATGAPQLFSAALIEITQSKHFENFKD